jgi:hypothetical protein
MPETILSRLTLSPFSSVSGLTTTQVQLDTLTSHFVEEAANPQTRRHHGGGFDRLGRIGILGMGSSSVLRPLSVIGGLGSEVAAFEFANRSFTQLWATGRSPLQENPNLWNWSGPGGWRDGLATSLVTFGTLRIAGSLARQQNLVLQHFLQSSAMVMGHQIAGGIGIAPRPEGTLAEQFLHAEATNLQLSAGSSLLHAMAPGLHALERASILHSFPQRSTSSPEGPNGLTPQWATALRR